jgi:hypothetical protein
MSAILFLIPDLRGDYNDSAEVVNDEFTPIGPAMTEWSMV